MRNRVNLYHLEADDFFDLLDIEFEDYILRNADTEKSLDKMRAAVAGTYDETYFPIDELYGTKDTPGPVSRVSDDPEGRAPRPYIPTTEQTDFGFDGLAPPVG